MKTLSVLGCTIWLGVLSLWIYGIWLSFSASFLVGVIFFLVEPAPMIEALVKVFSGKDLAIFFATFLK